MSEDEFIIVDDIENDYVLVTHPEYFSNIYIIRYLLKLIIYIYNIPKVLPYLIIILKLNSSTNYIGFEYFIYNRIIQNLDLFLTPDITLNILIILLRVLGCSDGLRFLQLINDGSDIKKCIEILSEHIKFHL